MDEMLGDLFPDGIAEHIVEFMPVVIEWMTVHGSTKIHETKHIVTYGGGPEGGFVYFYREREAGWYSWDRGWFQPAVYTKVDGKIAIWWDDDVERIGVVPHDYEPDEDEDIRVMDDEIMQHEE